VEFVLEGIPYFVREEDNILSNEVLDRLLGMLRVHVAVNRGQTPAVQDTVHVVRGYFRWLDGAEVEAARGALTGQSSIFEALRSEAFYEAVPKARASNLVPAIEELVHARSLMDVIAVLGRDFRGMSGMVGTLEDALDQRVPLGEIVEVAANYGGSIGEFVATMERALQRGRRSNAGHDQDGVALLTYFKSKGLQWHTVVLTSCNEGLIPHSRGQIEDERRLFYVAMTRASANLLVSYLANALNHKVAPSRFLTEAGLL
jgi:DNA helicase-2/ATP-dependent DNA helicase PcrA